METIEKKKRGEPRKPKRPLIERIPEAVAVLTALENAPDALDMDAETACIFYGGATPIDRATLYRGVRDGRYAKPHHPSPNISRFNLGEARNSKKALRGEAI